MSLLLAPGVSQIIRCGRVKTWYLVPHGSFIRDGLNMHWHFWSDPVHRKRAETRASVRRLNLSALR